MRGGVKEGAPGLLFGGTTNTLFSVKERGIDRLARVGPAFTRLIGENEKRVERGRLVLETAPWPDASDL